MSTRRTAQPDYKMPLRGGNSRPAVRLMRLRCWTTRCRCATTIRGVSPPPDEPREGRRTLPWRSLSAPKDHHHQYLTNVLPGYGVANMGSPAQICLSWHPCQLNPFARLTVGWLACVRVVIKGWKPSDTGGRMSSCR